MSPFSTIPNSKVRVSTLSVRSPPAQRHRPSHSDGITKVKPRQTKKQDSEWRDIYPYLRCLYPVMKLNEVIEKLSVNRGFVANSRQYTHRLKSHLDIPKYNNDRTRKKQLEQATSPHFIPEFKDNISLLLASELLLAFGHPATESLLRKIIKPHLTPNQRGLIPLVGYGLPIRHIATEACFASAFAVSGGRRQVGEMSLWRELASCVPDVQFGMSETTTSLFQDFSDFGYKAITGRSPVDSVNFGVKLATEKNWEIKDALGIFDIPAYVLWGSNYRSRTTETGSAALATEDEKIATSMYNLFQIQPLVKSEACEVHVNLFTDILHWMIFVLNEYTNNSEDTDIWQLPSTIKSWLVPTAGTKCTVHEQKMAVYLVLWSYLHREYTVEFSRKSSYIDIFKSKSPSPNGHRRSSSTSEHEDKMTMETAAEFSPWYMSSFYHVGIPPSLLLRLIITTLWTGNDSVQVNAIDCFRSKLETPEMYKLMNTPELQEDVMRDVTDIWEGVIDEAARVIAPNLTVEPHLNSRVWEELEEVLSTVVPPGVMASVRESNI